MLLARGYPFKCGILGFSVGQPDLPVNNRLYLWSMVYTALGMAERDRVHVVILHQYGASDLWGPAEKGGASWLINRLETQVLPRLPYHKVQFIVGEYGIDGLLLADLGRSVAETAAEPEFGVGVRTPAKPLYSDPASAQPDLTRGVSGPTGWQAFTDVTGYVKQLTDMGQWLSTHPYRARILGRCVHTPEPLDCAPQTGGGKRCRAVGGGRRVST